MKVKNLLAISGIMAILFVSLSHATWDVTTPAGTESKSLGDDRIREFKTDVQTALNTYGVFPGTDTANPKYYWTISSGTTINRPSNSVSTGTLYINVSSGCIERYLGSVEGWTCIQTVNPSFTLDTSTLTITTTSNSVYDYVTGTVNNILNIRNNATDTSTATASLRFWVGNANEAKIVAIRDPSASDSLDLAINMRKNGTRYQPIRWRGDGTTLYMSSNTYTGTSLFQSSATFNAAVTFSSSVVFPGQPKFFATSTGTISNVTGNGGVALAIFDNELYDIGNSINGSTFTATTAGYWELYACINFAEPMATSSEYRNIIFFVNQTNWKTSTADYSYKITNNAAVGVTSPTDETTICGGFTRNFALNDKVVIRVQASGGTADNVDIGGSTGTQAITWIQGKLAN